MRSNVRSLPASWCAPPGPLFLRAENYRSGVLPQPATAGDSEAPARTHARDHCSRSACALRLTRWTRWSASGVVGWLRPVPRGSIPRSSSLVRKGAVAVTFEFLLAQPVTGLRARVAAAEGGRCPGRRGLPAASRQLADHPGRRTNLRISASGGLH